MKKLLLLILIACPWLAHAQYNATAIIAQPDELSAFRYLPGRLQLGNRVVGLSLGNPYFYFGQNMAGANTVLNAFDAERGSADRSEDWRKLASKLKDRNRIGAVAEAMPLALAFRPGRESRFTFVFTSEVRAGMAASFNRQVGELIMVGNRGMDGQSMDLGDGLGLRAVGIQTFGVGTNIRLIDLDDLSLAVGGQIKWVRGLFSADLEVDRINFFSSEPELRFDYDYSLQTAGLDDRYDTRALQSAGSGFGLDLGASLSLGRNLEFSGSLINLGGVTFDKYITTYRGRDQFAWSGTEADRFLGFSRYNLDSLLDRLRPDEQYSGSFRQNIGPMLILQGVFRIPASNESYDAHRLGLTYFQGLAAGPLTSARPFLAASYLIHPVSVLGLGGSLGWGGHSGVAAGLMLALDTGFFRLGLGTQQLVGVMAPATGTATDFNLTLDFAF